MHYSPAPNIETTLLGLTLTVVDQSDGEVILTTADRSFHLHHDQDCCESVTVHDVKGDLADLIGTPLLSVKETISRDWPEDVPSREYCESYTWTTFTFTTAKGSVTIRWLGESNGYYSESVSFIETT